MAILNASIDCLSREEVVYIHRRSGHLAAARFPYTPAIECEEIRFPDGEDVCTPSCRRWYRDKKSRMRRSEQSLPVPWRLAILRSGDTNSHETVLGQRRRLGYDRV